MDSLLSKYEMVDYAVLHLLDAADEPMFADGPDGKPDESKPMRVGLFGPGSKQFAKAQTAYKNALVEKMSTRGGKGKLKPEEAVELRAKFLSAVTKFFENIPTGGLADQDAYIAVYGNPRLSFIPEQCEGFARDTANFKPAPSTPSASTSGTSPG